MRSLVDFVGALDPMETPLLTNPFGPPKYARKTITERIEPFATQYDELVRELPYDCPECGLPDPEWYEPTKRLRRLWSRLDTLRAQGFRDVPNPDYDAERAAEWYKKRGPLNQTKVTWGMSDLT